MAQIIMHDMLGLLKPYFVSEDHPKAIFERVKDELLVSDGKVRNLQESLGGQGGMFTVMSAAQQDGYDVMTGQQIWGLFNPTRRRDVSAWEFELFEAHQVMDVAQASAQTLAQQMPIGDMEVYVFPADPANRSLMVFSHGLSAFAGVPGALHLQIFPSEGNIRRVPAALARLLVHQLRRELPLNTLRDWLLTEGLAACFVETNFPEEELPWLASFRKPDDWDNTLTDIARRYGLNSYDEMTVNVYGSFSQVGAERPPMVHALPDDELTYVQEIASGALDESNPNRIAAYLYGDELIAPQGHATFGLSAYAGFEVAYRLVKARLEEAGLPLADALTATDLI